MLAEGSDHDHDSPLPIPLAPAPARQPPSKKRKRDAGTATPGPDEAADGVLPLDLSARPALAISRHPTFLPSPDGSAYLQTDALATNRLGFRYVPAGVAPPHFRTIESAPQSYRVSWEDRAPGVRVTPDGLGLAGARGFRSARCNAPVREGAWYMEVHVEHGGGARAPDTPSSKEGAHVRLGWARREAPLHGPAGLDGYSYALRDRTGEKVTLSRPRPYGAPVQAGDVVGMYIRLPPLRKPRANDPNDPARLRRERIAIEFKGQEYFEALEYAPSKEMAALMDNKPAAPAAPTPTPAASKKPAPGKAASRAATPAPRAEAPRPLPTLPDSAIAFFVNGATPGPAFTDLYDFRPLRAPHAKGDKLSRAERDRRRRARDGARGHVPNAHDDGSLGYYPVVSLFNDARVRLNPGPDFAFPPPADIDAHLAGMDVGGAEGGEGAGRERTWRPLCERYAEYMDEQWALDAEEEEELRRERELEGDAEADDAPPDAPDDAARASAPPPDADEEARAEADREAKREAKRLAKNEADRARRRRIKAEKEASAAAAAARLSEREALARAAAAVTPPPMASSSSARQSRTQTPAAAVAARAPTPVAAPPPAAAAAPSMYAADIESLADEDLRRDIEAERKKEAKRLAKNEADRARRRRLKLAKQMAMDAELQAAVAAASGGEGPEAGPGPGAGADGGADVEMADGAGAAGEGPDGWDA